MASPVSVQIKTIDGLTLRGLVYPASAKGPGIILSPPVRAAHA